jgi:hypothetical protein
MPYTGRFSLVPPVLYVNGPAEYVDQVNRWAEQSGKIEGCSAEFWSLVKDAQLTHIYLHRGVGKLQPGPLLNCAGVNVVYQNDEVFIYSIQSER